jgi:hypothetical protein
MDDELAAFQAELSQMGSSSKPSDAAAAAGPKAPKVISSLPVRSMRVSGDYVQPPAPTYEPAGPSGGRHVDYDQFAQAELELRNAPPPTAFGAPGERPPPPPGFDPRRRYEHLNKPPEMVAPVEMDPSQWTHTAPVAPPKPVKANAETSTKRFCAGKSWEDPTLAEWPDDDFRIFVGDLGNETNDDVLAHAFGAYPSFQKARVVRNKGTQKSLGYGFVSFKDPWDMTKALREMHGKYIGNRPVKVRKSTWAERSQEQSSTKQQWVHAMAVNDKKERSKLKTTKGKQRPHVHKRQKNMPW